MTRPPDHAAVGKHGGRTEESCRPTTTQAYGPRLKGLLWVTTGKARSEQIESALPLKAAVERTFAIDSFVPSATYALHARGTITLSSLRDTPRMESHAE